MSSPQAWREGPLLVVPQGAPLPPRCVRCGAPAPGPARQVRIYWHHPAIYVLLLNLLVYAVVALLARRSVRIELPVCAAHVSRRRRGNLIALLGVGAGLTLVGFGVAAGHGPLSLLGGYLAVAGSVAGVVASRLYGVDRVDARGAVLRGAHPDLLDMLPERSA
ncbi:MAG: hypothetical protein KJ067_14350 [Vicinamibacteria bacterium]|jgi:hypothetical protein|nr:hypothetical protein [Vicinamibacteria bacterium]